MELLPLGKILKTRGIKGEVKFFPFSGQVDSIINLKRLFIQKKGEEKPKEFKVVRLRSHNKSHFIELKGISTIEDANELRGSTVLIEKSDLPQLREDEYYWFQLIGIKVYTNDGEYLGKIENLMDREPQSLLVVRHNDKEILIPMIDSIIEEINLKKSKVIITPIDGLVD